MGRLRPPNTVRRVSALWGTHGKHLRCFRGAAGTNLNFHLAFRGNLFYNGITTITTGYVTNEIFNAILEKGINNVKNLERVCYNNAYELSGDFVMNIDNCTTLYQFFYNNRVVDETTFSIDFNGSTGKVENFSYTFGGGSTKFYVPVTAIYNINMDVATNVAAFTSYAKFLTTITFDGSFGGKTTTSTLTLDLSTTGITLETFKNMVNSMDPCTNGKTRNIKVKSSLFSQIEVDDIYIDAIEKGYSITS